MVFVLVCVWISVRVLVVFGHMAVSVDGVVVEFLHRCMLALCGRVLL